MTWYQIQQAPRHGLGSEKIEYDSIKSTKPDIVTKDSTILALRFSGKKPFVGIRDGSLFHIIWIDNKFNLYKHN